MSKENKTDYYDLNFHGGVYPSGIIFEEQLLPKDMKTALKECHQLNMSFDVAIILRRGVKKSDKQYPNIKNEVEVEDEHLKKRSKKQVSYVTGSTTLLGIFKCASNRIVSAIRILPDQGGDAREMAFTIRRNLDYREETAFSALRAFMPLQERSAPILPIQPKKPQTAQTPSASLA